MLSAILSIKRSYSAMLLIKQPIHQRFAFPGPLVLGSTSLSFLTLAVDRNQTVSRRSKPSSRTTLIGEQPNPWNLFQLRDVMSRHRGAKRFRRFELLRIISLLSPAYLLSVERWLFHTKSPDHYDQLSFLFDMSILQSSKFLPLRSTIDYKYNLNLPLYTSVTL